MADNGTEHEEYLVRGAFLCCTYGTHHRRLNLPWSHGSYIKEREYCLMNAMDNDPGEGQGHNIPPFGICQSPEFPQSGKPILLITEKVNPLNGEPYKNEDGSVKKLEDNVKGYRCEAIFNEQWQNTHSATLIGAKDEIPYEALTTRSFLACKYLGFVFPENSGQPVLDPPIIDKTESKDLPMVGEIAQLAYKPDSMKIIPSNFDDIGDYVFMTQHILDKLGFYTGLEYDSSRYFGENTVCAVMRFQMLIMDYKWDELFDKNGRYIGVDAKTAVALNKYEKSWENSKKHSSNVGWDHIYKRYLDNGEALTVNEKVRNPKEYYAISSKDSTIYKALVTKKQLSDLLVKSNHVMKNAVTDNIVGDLNKTLFRYDITSTELIQYFLGACMHESRTGLTQVGSNYIYRGAGYIQFSEPENYKKMATEFNDNDIYKKGAKYVADNYAWEAAGWWWNENRINKRVDESNSNGLDNLTIFKKVSRAVRYGNYNSANELNLAWSDRKNRYQEVITVIN